MVQYPETGGSRGAEEGHRYTPSRGRIIFRSRASPPLTLKLTQNKKETTDTRLVSVFT